MRTIDLFPYVLFFFVARFVKSIEVRRNHFQELLGEYEGARTGIFPFLLKAGLSRTKLGQPCITYAMTEKAAISMHTAYPESFG